MFLYCLAAYGYILLQTTWYRNRTVFQLPLSVETMDKLTLLFKQMGLIFVCLEGWIFTSKDFCVQGYVSVAIPRSVQMLTVDSSLSSLENQISHQV